MLVLTRRPKQRIIIGDDIYLELLEIRGNVARLGINAPKGLSIHREEIWVKIKKHEQEEQEGK